MIQEFFSAVMYMLMAKFVLNDVPHAVGFLANPASSTQYGSSHNPRLERTTTNKILDDLERTWHRIESDMSYEMQSALGILKEVMGYYYEEPCVAAWDNGNLAGVAVYETYDDANLGTRETHIKSLASFSHEPGIGRSLVQEVIKIAGEEKSQYVTLSYGPGAKSFYERLGFVEDTRLMPAGEVGTLMMYKLKSGNPQYKRPIPHNLEVLVPGDMAEEERVRRWFAYEDARIKAVKRFEDARSKVRRDALKYAWDEVTYQEAIAEAQRVFHEEAEVKAKEILRTPSGIAPTGTCYEDAWRYLIKEEEGLLVHGSVQFSAEAPRVNHAWVELSTGWVWEPQTKSYYTIEDFQIMSPMEEHRYTSEQAAIIVARSGNMGPWSEEERIMWFGETR